MCIRDRCSPGGAAGPAIAPPGSSAKPPGLRATVPPGRPGPAQKGEPIAGERLASVRSGPERSPDLDGRAGLLLASGL
eukprot:12169811-Alexandrium_andersonii.AAC.1